MRSVKIKYSTDYWYRGRHVKCPYCKNKTSLKEEEEEGDVIICDDCGEEIELRIETDEDWN